MEEYAVVLYALRCRLIRNYEILDLLGTRRDSRKVREEKDLCLDRIIDLQLDHREMCGEYYDYKTNI